MNSAIHDRLQRRVRELQNLPAMPTVITSLSECLSVNAAEVDLARITELISYDKSLAAQCLRVANSALFARRSAVDSVKAAVLSLGVARVRDIVYSCALPKTMAGAQGGIEPMTFWRHALGTALVAQHLAQNLCIPNADRFYLAGLLHDIGILVNALLFRSEFPRVFLQAEKREAPLYEMEKEILGFTHCDSGRVLADFWKLPPDISATIESHHEPAFSEPDLEMICVVHLADLLCRLRGLGYGYYEARQFDLSSEPAWHVLEKHYPAIDSLDLARFTLELDEYAARVQDLVNSIFAQEKVPA